MDSLRTRYTKEIKPKLGEELGIKNPMAIPGIKKVVINMGVGGLFRDKGMLDKALEEMGAIAGQKPAIRPATKSIAGFNIRAGMPVGVAVTLRGERAYNFLSKFISVVLPRLRDFRGVSVKSFDKNGNYTLGMPEHTVFPEIDLGKVDKAKSMEITIVTNAGSKEKGKALLSALGMPFEKEEDK